MTDTETSPYRPERAVFETTLGCNLRCKHCGSRAGRPRDDELTVAECAPLFGDLARLGNRWLTLSGGEPLARPDWLELVAAASEAGLRAGMITNAVALDRKAVAAARDAGLVSFGFSLDGLEATHDRTRGRRGHFWRLFEAMEDCAAERMPFAVVTHLNRQNLGQLDAMHELVVRRGAYAWQVQLGTDMGSFSDHPELMPRPRDLVRIERELAGLVGRSPIRVHVSDSIGYYGPGERSLRRFAPGRRFGGCPAGLRVVGIESNGNVKGCLSILAGYNERGAEFVEGNIRETSLAEIWRRPGAFSYNRGFSIDDLGGACRDCRHAARCRGGCTAKKVASGGGVENPMCVRRVLEEEGDGAGRLGAAAAAVVLATTLGGGLSGCRHTDGDEGDAGAEPDTDSETETATDSDSTPAPEYGMPDTDSDTGPTTDYGMPDTGGDDYGMPDTDTGGMDEYGMPCL